MSDTRIDSSILFPRPIEAGRQQQKSPPVAGGAETPFSRLLERAQERTALTFSRHAESRLQSRGIVLSDEEKGRLVGVVDAIARKGGRESLVMMGETAFIVSITNRTVVTALDREGMKGNVFTNIDSAAII